MSTLQLSLFDLVPAPAKPRPVKAAPAPELDAEAQAWLATQGYTPEARVLLDPARLARELARVDPADLQAVDDLSRYVNNGRYGAQCTAPQLVPKYDALRPALDKLLDACDAIDRHRDTLLAARERLAAGLANADDWRALERVRACSPPLAVEAAALLDQVGDACPWLLDLDELLARRPAPALDAETVAALAARGVTYVGSYAAWNGIAFAREGQPVHVLRGRWTPNGVEDGRMDWTDAGLARWLEGGHG